MIWCRELCQRGFRPEVCMQTSFLRWAGSKKKLLPRLLPYWQASGCTRYVEPFALSNRLQVELPGLRGFSASNIKSMRIFYEAWKEEGQIRQMPSDESVSPDNRPTTLGESVIRQSSTDELATCKWRNVISFNSTIANGRKPHAPSPRSSKESAANSLTGSRSVQ